MFVQRLWMIPIAQWLGLLTATLCGLMVMHGASAWWLALWAAGHVCGSLAVSVGLHRYFTHGAFATSRFWHWVLALWGTLTMQGSPLGWAAAHQAHHDHSDEPGDPHYTGWSYLLLKQYNAVPMPTWRVRMLVSDAAVAFSHRYALVVVALWCALLLAVGALTHTGAAPLLFGYLAPLGTTHLIGAVHQVISHRWGGARNFWLLELILPAMGEWHHKFHHDHPRAWRLGDRWWHLDLGAAFIRCIKA